MEKLRGKKVAVRRAFNRAEWLNVKLEMIEQRIITHVVPLREWEKREAIYADIEKYDWVERDWRRIRLGETWGAEDRICFFRRRVVLPREFAGRYAALRMVFGGESLVYINGREANGLNPMRDFVPLTPRARAGQAFDVEVIAHVWSFPDDVRNEVDADQHILQQADLIAVDKVVESAWYDLKVAYDAAMAFELVNPEIYNFIIERLSAALMLADRYESDPGRYRRALCRAAAEVRRTIYASEVFRPEGKIWMVGHSHLDIAFHWATRHGARKAARTAVVQLALMDEFPEFRFCQTQPWTYACIKRFWPRVFARLKEKVRAGQWEPIGAMWVEPDCNLPSGESLVRQMLLGQRFWEREFGIRSRTVFMPDVFGCSWILPQIMRRAGVNYFLTHKQSTWNDTNTFPHSLFWWKGIDGSRVLAVIPSSHFISQVLPQQLLENWTKWRQRREFPESLYCFGYGDGGGGPTRQMLEYARRVKHLPGLPRMEHTRVEDYLDRAVKKARNLPVWEDELYLEMHRGTYTTKGHFKRWNRLAECAFREAELWSALRFACGGAADSAYPQERLNRGWDALLTNQFHDIIPGSHTEQVAEEGYITFPRNLRLAEEIRDAALQALAAGVDAGGLLVVVFNSLPWERTDVVETIVRVTGDFHLVDGSGRPVVFQVVGREGEATRIVFVAEDVPSVGYCTFRIVPGAPPRKARRAELRVARDLLENAFFRLRLERGGCLESIRDKRAGREVLPRGALANRFQLFEDKPGIYDAWDIVRFYKEEEFALPPAESVEIIETGPVRAALRITRRIRDSRLVQDLILYAQLPRIEFRTRVNWKERQKLLKVAFPVDVHTRTATYDLDFGCIERPTHANTSWDEAKYEVCAHKWADLSEGNYGVSLLNDCKYGHDIRDGVMRLTLLKGSVYPDEFADIGEHEFTYWLYPHAGDWRVAGTVRLGHEVNAPLRAVTLKGTGAQRAAPVPPQMSFLRINCPNVMLTALKKAEDSDDLVLRFVELHNQRCQVAVELAQTVLGVRECNLLEDDGRRVPHGARSFAFALGPFEIRTFKVKVGGMR